VSPSGKVRPVPEHEMELKDEPPVTSWTGLPVEKIHYVCRRLGESRPAALLPHPSILREFLLDALSQFVLHLDAALILGVE
jgi:hypothetical protein